MRSRLSVVEILRVDMVVSTPAPSPAALSASFCVSFGEKTFVEVTIFAS